VATMAKQGLPRLSVRCQVQCQCGWKSYRNLQMALDPKEVETLVGKETYWHAFMLPESATVKTLRSHYCNKKVIIKRVVGYHEL